MDSDGNRLVGPRANQVEMLGAHPKLEGAGLRHSDDEAVSDRMRLVPNPVVIAVVQHYVLDIDERRRADVIKGDEHTADAGVRGSVRRHERGPSYEPWKESETQAEKEAVTRRRPRCEKWWA